MTSEIMIFGIWDRYQAPLAPPNTGASADHLAANRTARRWAVRWRSARRREGLGMPAGHRTAHGGDVCGDVSQRGPPRGLASPWSCRDIATACRPRTTMSHGSAHTQGAALAWQRQRCKRSDRILDVPQPW